MLCILTINFGLWQQPNPKESSKNQFILLVLMNFILTEYSSNVSKCLTNWTKRLQDCDGDANCLEEAGKELRGCLDAAFPPSTKLEFESDKINYMLSTIFFLSNRLTKAITGLSEVDKVIDNFVKKERQSLDEGGSGDGGDENKISSEMGNDLNDILAKYF